MAHSCSSQAEEDDLARALKGLDEGDPAYAATLSDLAVIKLNKGHVAEAQRMFDRIAAGRSDPHAPSPPAHSNGAAATAAATAPPTTPQPETPGCDSSSSTTTTATNPRPQQPSPAGTSSSRPRGGGGGGGMGGGVAMFARALGGRPTRPASARGSQRGSGSETSSEAAPPPAASGSGASGLTPNRAGTEASGPRGTKVAESEPAAAVAVAAGSETSSASASPARTAVVQAGWRGAAGEGKPRAAELPEVVPAAAVTAPAGGAAAAPAGRSVGGSGTSYSDVTGAERGRPGPAGAATGAAADAYELTATASGATVAAQYDEDGPSAAKSAAAASSRVATPSESPPGLAAGAVGSYPSAAAAVAAMTEKPAGWGAGSGSAGGRHGGRRASGGGSGSGGAGVGGSGGGGRSAAAPVVMDYHLEPRAADVEGDPSTSESDAALRASLGECTHVLEVYDLTTEVRTAHLQEFVTELAHQDGRPLPVIKWVDDSHALLVCPDGATALYLLQVDQDLFQLRPFTEASAASKAVAATDLLPPRERPKTTAAVAKRLLSHALGMRQLRDRDAEKDLAEQRKAAREARREREQKLAAAWDDD